MINPFCPQYKSGQELTAAAAQIASINRDADQIRIANNGTATAYICCYDSTGTVQVADATDFAVFPGQSSTITKSESHDKLSYFCATSTTLVIMTGKGI